MNPILRALATADAVLEANARLEALSAAPVIKLWQVSLLGLDIDQTWHGTVEAPSFEDAKTVARTAAHEEGWFDVTRPFEAYVTFLPDGHKVCPACRGQHSQPGRFCTSCINDGDAEAFEDRS